jgi:hypothetical protein
VLLSIVVRRLLHCRSSHRSTINHAVRELVLRGVTVKNQCFEASLLMVFSLQRLGFAAGARAPTFPIR